MSILTDFNPPFLPMSLVRDVFIDTGMADFAEAGDGCSLRNALRQQFKEYHGIEISARNYVSAVGRMAKPEMGMFPVGLNDADDDGSSPEKPRSRVSFKSHFRDVFRCTLWRGSSPDVLATILDPAKSTLIWCDAHWQGLADRPDEMDPKYGQCPLLAELRAILAVPWRVSPIILMDDCHQFSSDAWWEKYGAPFDRKQWPSWQQIYDLLEGWTVLIRAGIAYCWNEHATKENQ